MADAGLTRVAVAVVAAQGATAVIAGIVILIRGGDSYAVGTGVFALILGIALGLIARALRGGASWARTPVLFIQLLALPIGLGLLQGGQAPLGLVVLLVAVGTGLTVLAS